MFDIIKESTEHKIKKSNLNKPLSKDVSKSNNYNILLNDFNETKSLKADTSQSGSQSPSSFTNPSSPLLKTTNFLQNISFKTMPSFDSYKTLFNQINCKSQKFIKVTNDLTNKIDLLEEIYDGSEYRKIKVVNKLIQCRIDINTSQKIVLNLISKLNPSNDMCSERSIHPAYSNEITDEIPLNMDNSETFKVPGSYQDQMSSNHSPSISSTKDLFADYPPVDCEQPIQDDQFFIEHEGNTYVRVDETNYHLIQSVSEDGIITTETGLQLLVPEGVKIPFLTSNHDSNMIQDDLNISNNTNDYESQLDQNQYFPDPIPDPIPIQPNRKSYKDNGYLSQYTYQTSNPAKPFSDYVGLPPRPAPLMPFTLSSQLYTPELSISLTDRDCELMLTIDCPKKSLPQQPSLYYQIYSYKDEDRYAKPTSEVWGLVGEISACPLPMFCTISIPSGVHKHYFSIRSVDEFNRFSDWSNVVQVEVESNQNSINGR